MVAQLLRLKLALVAGSFRRRPLAVAGMVVGLLYAVALAVLAVVGFVALRSESADIARVLVVVAGGAVLVGFLLVPLSFGADDVLDPRRFALFGIPTSRLYAGLGIASLVSIPSAFLVVLSFAQIVTWSRDGLATVLAVVAAPVIVATGVLLSRVASAVSSFALATRRWRDVTSTALVVLLALLAPGTAILATLDWESHSLPILRRIAAVVTWTPFGAPWAVPADAANGRADEAFAKLAIAVGFLVVLAVAWRLLVGLSLSSQRREASRRRYTRLGWFDRMPDSAFGVVAARSLSYWSRDPRYVFSLAAIPLIPLLIVPLWVAGVPAEVIAWLPVPLMCLFLGWLVHNDVAQDSTAFWLHLSSSTSGLADRWGRLVPGLLLGVPLAAVGSTVTVALIDAWSLLPALIGLSLGSLLVALGVSSVASAGYPYPAVRPGDSPFAQPQAAGATGSVVQAVSVLAILLVLSPVVWLIALAAQDPALYWAAAWAGVGVGVVAIVGGTAWGGRIMDRHSPELLEFTLQN
ncbi:hypothetical protein [Antiquaquibacter soli]|uniref:ABC-2 type transport system permease protein n=1 Tax=Antiquaquibacter soli TaxID=3064523 RepID=A0ABT9BK37_9MICO|nr:hypothetical protein [Protaetiibacter sp. WY-16]MDO7881388.1 hypothetical protein [Protaetiibacter sp. WY-16]